MIYSGLFSHNITFFSLDTFAQKQRVKILQLN